MKKYEYNEFLIDIDKLVKQINSNFSAIVIVARGGLTIGHFLANRLNIRKIYTINSILYNNDNKLKKHLLEIPDIKEDNLLLVDDIIDSGETIYNIKNKLNKNIKVATIFYKKTAIVKPDFFVKYASEWIEFFWE